MEIHVDFCVPCLEWNASDPESAKSDIYQSSSSFTLGEYFKNHEPIIQEVSYEHLNEEVVHFDDESGSKLEVELEVDPIV